MNATATNQTRLVIVGATGMVGCYALRYALDHPAVCRVTAIGRRSLGISHPKLKEVLHKDFADCSALAERSRIRTQRSFASVRIQGRYRTRNSPKQPRTTQWSSRVFSTAAVPMRCSHS